MTKFRTEKDSIGEVRIPAGALWGASTQRAIDNFPVSSRRFPRPFIRALALIKLAAAETNASLGIIDGRFAAAIARNARSPPRAARSSGSR